MDTSWHQQFNLALREALTIGSQDEGDLRKLHLAGRPQ